MEDFKLKHYYQKDIKARQKALIKTFYPSIKILKEDKLITAFLKKDEHDIVGITRIEEFTFKITTENKCYLLSINESFFG